MNIVRLNTTGDIVKKGGSGGGTGGGGSTATKWTGHADAEGLRAIGWTDEDIAYYQENGVNWNAEDDEYHKVSEDNKALYGVLTADNISTYADRIVYLPKIDTSGVTDMSGMFYACSSLVSIPQLNTQNVTHMSGMFSDCYALVSIPQLNTQNVTNMSEMFHGCSALVSIPQLDTQNVTNMSWMFINCYALVSIPQLNTQNVTNMGGMLAYCPTIKAANLENVTQDCTIEYSALLRKDSLLYIINNEAATSAITISLHPYAYERLANDADVLSALANHPRLSLVELEPEW